MRDLTERVRAATRMIDKARTGSDPAEQDYCEILPIRRPRRGSGTNMPQT